jgi:F-type H+-transporting ATPase subunit delta
VNTGIITDRYAEALLKYVLETGRGEQAVAQAERIEASVSALPELSRLMLSRDIVSGEEKKALLRSCVDGELEDSLDRFFTLLVRNGRIGLVRETLHRFIDLYRQDQGVRKATLRTVAPPSGAFLAKLSAMVKELTGDEARIEVVNDPSIIGGFVLDIDDYLLDTSVSRQLEIIREQFIENNRRIV